LDHGRVGNARGNLPSMLRSSASQTCWRFAGRRVVTKFPEELRDLVPLHLGHVRAAVKETLSE
jgi:hypothetical protein